jgi:hypothetical protein
MKWPHWRHKPPRPPKVIGAKDAMEVQAIQQAWLTGKPVIVTRDDDGNVHTTVYDDGPEGGA